VYAHRLGRAGGDAQVERTIVDLLVVPSAAKTPQTALVAVACGARMAVARLVTHTAASDARLCHAAAYNLDHAMLRVLWSHWAGGDLPLTSRTAVTERTPLCCALAQLARLLHDNPTAAVEPNNEEATRFALDDTAAEARTLVEAVRTLPTETPAPVMVPIGSAADGIETARLLLVADAAGSVEVTDAHGRCAVHYWAACVALARSTQKEALLALMPLFPSGATQRLPSSLWDTSSSTPSTRSSSGRHRETRKRKRTSTTTSSQGQSP
jgi:hypothetical protein